MKKWLLLVCAALAISSDTFAGKDPTEIQTATLLEADIDTSAELAAILGDETGSGLAVFATSPTITTPTIVTSLSQDGDVADSGYIRLQNASVVGWEASPAGTDVTLSVDASEVMQCSGTFNAGVLTEAGNGVPNSTNNLSFFSATTSSQLAGVISDETGGTGVLVFGTSPTITTSLSQDGDVADAGYFRLQNAATIGWEASPAGTDVTLSVDASEVMQCSGTFNATALTEGGVGVPNTGDNLSVFAATTSAQLAGVLNDETGGSGVAVFASSPSLTGQVSFSSGAAVTAGSYQVGRDTDATNQLHFNVPTGATFEWSVNDAVEATLSATAVNFQNNSLTTTGGGSLTGTWSDLGSVTTIDINGGTVDGATIGASSAGTGTFTNLTSTTGTFTISTTAGITASTTQTQGQGALTRTMNEVSTVANNNDTVTLPAAAAGLVVYVANNGANTLQVFPASGDAIDGASVNTAKTLTSGTNMQYVAHDATNWNSFRGAL